MDLSSELVKSTRDAKTIYFVCSGNIIRSSFAELYARYLGIENTGSYGTTYHNSNIHTRTANKLRELGVESSDISNFKPTHISEIDSFDDTDLHVIMTEKHHKDLISEGISPEQIVFITEYLGKKDNVEDPYFSNNYDEAYQTISKAVRQIIDILS